MIRYFGRYFHNPFTYWLEIGFKSLGFIPGPAPMPKIVAPMPLSLAAAPFGSSLDFPLVMTNTIFFADLSGDDGKSFAAASNARPILLPPDPEYLKAQDSVIRKMRQ